ARGTGPDAAFDVGIPGGEALLLIAIRVIRRGEARLDSGLQKCPIERVMSLPPPYGDRPAGSTIRAGRAQVSFASAEVRQHFCVRPARGALRKCPPIEVKRVPAQEHHSVDRRGTTERLTRWLEYAAAREMPLRDGPKGPVEAAALEVSAERARHVDR